jgi:hypothetical protein
MAAQHERGRRKDACDRICGHSLILWILKAAPHDVLVHAAVTELMLA